MIKEEVIYSPYRVCPLGAHVDHQHGLVTGFAIDKGVKLSFTKSKGSIVDIKSLSYSGSTNFDIKYPIESKENNWMDYVRASAYALKKHFHLKHGIQGTINGTLPVGGLSSSAAVLVAYVIALASANEIFLTQQELIKITSEAEREYIGLNNGILDQACVVLGKENHLLYLDTDNNDFQLLPSHNKMPPFELGIVFSGLTRSLIASDYNLRVSECRASAWNILAFKNQTLSAMEKTYLRDIPEEFYAETKKKLPVRFAKRAEHFYSEMSRVRMGINEWQKGDLVSFGKLIFDSCESSINNYECGSPELIAIYDIMRETDGVYGGRFSGAGFKGACMSIIDPSKRESIREAITDKYLNRFPQYRDSFDIHFCKTDTGTRFLS